MIFAAAGSGKTTWIAREIAMRQEADVAVTTFTLLNYDRIVGRVWNEFGNMPSGVRIQPWFSFLLQDLVRPYQNYGGRTSRIKGVNLAPGQSTRGLAKSDQRYWFDAEGSIYTDKISEFAIRCDDSSNGAVLRRLARLYRHLYIDEVQDLAGYDLDLVERIIRSGLCVTMVGDPRQATYSTNQGGRHRQYRRAAIAEKFREWEKQALCEIVEQSHSYRCVDDICKLADCIYPGYCSTESRNVNRTQHDGVVVVKTAHVSEYLKRYSPQVLRYDKRCDSLGQNALNFGNAKGLEFERVLIVPTNPIRQWLASGDLGAVEKSLAKFYVAVTRAKQSVAFVHDGEVRFGDLIREWAP